jgi:hypothetical protein
MRAAPFKGEQRRLGAEFGHGAFVGSAGYACRTGVRAASRILLSRVAMVRLRRSACATMTRSNGSLCAQWSRHPDSDIFLDDATVSRHHVEFRLENGQFLLVDLDSLNNTYVNHEPVDSAVLVNGDEIQIGKFRLVFLTRPTTAETRTFRWIGACAHPDDAVKSCSAGWPNRPHDR